jgi:hypothetical protein
LSLEAAAEEAVILVHSNIQAVVVLVAFVQLLPQQVAVVHLKLL